MKLSLRLLALSLCIWTAAHSSVPGKELVTKTQILTKNIPAQSALEGLSQISAAGIVNAGIYQLVSTLKNPAVLVIGTEGLALLTLAYAQQDPAAFLTNLITPESLSALALAAGQTATEGFAYKFGEQASKALISKAESFGFANEARAIITGLSAAGYGFYSWSTSPENAADSAIKLSLCSGALLHALTDTVSKSPYTQRLQKYVSDQVASVGGSIGKIVGVATITAGTAALVYKTGYAQEVGSTILKGAYNSLTNPVESAQALKTMVRNNLLWFQGYGIGSNTLAILGS